LKNNAILGESELFFGCDEEEWIVSVTGFTHESVSLVSFVLSVYGYF